MRLGDATKLELGQSLIAIGNALGIFRNTVSVGIVSGLSRSITAQAEPNAPPQEMRGLIQTDAAINPGNSGGPIVDRDGCVVGVNAAIVSGAQSIGFAIPVNAARRDIDDIKKYGRIRRPLLGLRYIMIDAALQKKMDLPVDYGALVMRESQHDAAVVPESPAEKAGIQEKDIVLEINGKETRQQPSHPGFPREFKCRRRDRIAHPPRQKTIPGKDGANRAQIKKAPLIFNGHIPPWYFR